MAVTLIATLNETHKGLLVLWSYRFNMAVMLARLSVFFVLMSLFTGRGRLDEELLAPALVGYIVWFYAATGITTMGRNLTEEAQAGTLEQMYMTPAPTGMIVLGRSLSAVAVSTVMITAIVTPLALALDVDIPVRWEALPVFILALSGIFGLGFMIAGATLVFKQVDQLANLVENLLMFLSGALLPVHLLPGGLQLFSSTLPTTQGIIVLRDVVLEGQSLAAEWATGALPWLLLNSGAYLLVGWLIFKACERIARQRGSLGQY